MSSDRSNRPRPARRPSRRRANAFAIAVDGPEEVLIDRALGGASGNLGWKRVRNALRAIVRSVPP